MSLNLEQQKAVALANARKRAAEQTAAPIAAPKKPGVVDDVAKSVGSNVVGGGIDLAMTLPNILNQLVAGPQLLGRGIAENISPLLGAEPQPRGELWQPFLSSYDVEKMAGTDYEPQTTAGKAVALPARIGGGILGGKGLQKTVGKALEPKPKVTRADFSEKANVAYQKMRDEGAILNRGGINKVTRSVGDALQKKGLLNESIHKDTLSVVGQLNKDAASGSMGLERLDQYRQLLNEVVKKNTSKLEGMNPDAFKAQEAIGALDDVVDSLGGQYLLKGTPSAIKALNEGRKYYAASARMRTTDRILETALQTDNPQTAIKTGFRNLAKQLRDNPRGWSKEEIKAVNHAARTGVLTGALKLAGSRIISTMTGAMGGAAAAGPFGAGAGAAVGAVGATPFRMGANALQRMRGEGVNRAIINRAMEIPPTTYPSTAGPAGVVLPLEALRQQLNSQ